MYKNSGFFIISFLLLLVLGACSTSSSNKRNALESVEQTSGPSVKQKVESDKIDESNNETGIEYKNADLVVEDATFSGQVDAHTIEVKTVKGVMALQIGSVGEVDWSSLAVDAPITIEYYENEFGQFELTNYLVK